MSIIACRILNNQSYEMASDSITARGWTQSKGDRSYHSKLVEVNEMVIGAAGLASESAMFQLFASTRRPADATVESLLRFMGEFCEWKKKSIDNATLECQYLIGFMGKVFRIHSWFIEQIATFEAIGAGEDFALAAMHLGHSAESAVKVACELSVFCEPPIITIKKS